MGMITIEINTRVYAPWEDEADDRECIEESTEPKTFDTARECADWLIKEGLQSPSVSPGPYDRFTWLAELDPYEHPYTGTLTERSAHVEGEPAEFNPRLWAAIVHVVSRDFTHYSGPYYVERRNVFGTRL
jgi:hypothetical protein